MSATEILVVEDEAIVAEDLSSKLRRLGYQVAGIAAEGEEAIEMADRLHPHLILMDIRLAGEVDGIAAAKAIGRTHDVPVIYLTAHSDPATLSRAKITGPFGYILKPFDERELATQIELALYKHKSEQRIREQREWLQVTLKSIGDAVIATDAQGRITFVNPVAEVLTGWGSDECEGLPVTEIFRVVNEQTCEPIEEPVSRVLREVRVVPLDNHAALVTRNGDILPIEDTAAPILDATGNVIGVVLVFHDVTAKRRAKEKLRASEERYHQLLSVMPAAMYACDADGVITYFNNQAAQLWRCSPNPGDTDLRFCGSFRLYRPDGSFLPHDQTPMATVLKKGISVRNQEVIIEQPGGSRVWASVNIDPIRDNAGRITGAINVLADISERKKAEEKLHKLNETLEERVAERTELAEDRAKQLQHLSVELIETEERERQRISQLLHDDLQQILASARLQLQGGCARLPESSPLGPVFENVNALMSQSIEKSRRLAYELSPPVLAHSELSGSLEWLARQMKEQFGLTVRLGLDSAPRLINSPLKVFVFRAVQELLFNCTKHAGVNTARVDVSGKKGRLTIKVSDDGSGFDPEILESTVITAGFGLLSLRERARFIGGQLMIESAPDFGSKITLAVPLHLSTEKVLNLQQQTSLSSRILKDTEVSTKNGDIRVLFVDDHRVMRQGLVAMIEGQPNIEVIGEASNGREAVEKVRQLVPNVVVMDVSMPEMDGIEATRRIKSEWPDVRIIGLSMHENEQIAQTMQQAGAEVLMTKTASPSELLQAIYGL